MSDWFEEGRQTLLDDIVSTLGASDISPDTVDKVYSVLVNWGLIDYDIEKDIIWERYGSEGEDE